MKKKKNTKAKIIDKSRTTMKNFIFLIFYFHIVKANRGTDDLSESWFKIFE